MYKHTVEQIKNLKWENLSGVELRYLLWLSYYAAREFAESLRIALDLYPTHEGLLEMAIGELKTSNLHFADYKARGDHSDFLKYFIFNCQDAMLDNNDALCIAAGEKYLEKVRKLPKEVRAMSIVSREAELSGIFKRILLAKEWPTLTLQAFRYFLDEHIRLDSMEGGHADLLSDFPVTEQVQAFYGMRLDLYRCIPTLFK